MFAAHQSKSVIMENVLTKQNIEENISELETTYAQAFERGAKPSVLTAICDKIKELKTINGNS
ncbi:MAG: hypothetical protein C4330_09555 [Chitinophagaceae bacterium]